MTSFLVLLALLALLVGALNRTHRRSARPWASLAADRGLDRDWVRAKAELLALGGSGIDRRPFRGPDRADAAHHATPDDANADPYVHQDAVPAGAAAADPDDRDSDDRDSDVSDSHHSGADWTRAA